MIGCELRAVVVAARRTAAQQRGLVRWVEVGEALGEALHQERQVARAVGRLARAVGLGGLDARLVHRVAHLTRHATRHEARDERCSDSDTGVMRHDESSCHDES